MGRVEMAEVGFRHLMGTCGNVWKWVSGLLWACGNAEVGFQASYGDVWKWRKQGFKPLLAAEMAEVGFQASYGIVEMSK